MADPNTFRDKGHVETIDNIQLTPEFQCLNYLLETRDITISATGHLSFIWITHSSGWPIYKGRWDEKNLL